MSCYKRALSGSAVSRLLQLADRSEAIFENLDILMSNIVEIVEAVIADSEVETPEFLGLLVSTFLCTDVSLNEQLHLNFCDLALLESLRKSQPYDIFTAKLCCLSDFCSRNPSYLRPEVLGHAFTLFRDFTPQCLHPDSLTVLDSILAIISCGCLPAFYDQFPESFYATLPQFFGLFPLIDKRIAQIGLRSIDAFFSLDMHGNVMQFIIDFMQSPFTSDVSFEVSSILRLVSGLVPYVVTDDWFVETFLRLRDFSDSGTRLNLIDFLCGISDSDTLCEQFLDPETAAFVLESLDPAAETDLRVSALNLVRHVIELKSDFAVSLFFMGDCPVMASIHRHVEMGQFEEKCAAIAILTALIPSHLELFECDLRGIECGEMPQAVLSIFAMLEMEEGDIQFMGLASLEVIMNWGERQGLLELLAGALGESGITDKIMELADSGNDIAENLLSVLGSQEI
jgi:hypothetical protein